MTLMKVTRQSNIQMEVSTIFSARMVSTKVTEFEQTLVDQFIEESSKRAGTTVMDSLSMQITMSMTVNFKMAGNMEKECSRVHQLEELKEDFMKIMKSKKSLKS
jgi:hypothetical protein